MFGLRGSELVIVLLILLVLFGGSKLPQLGAGLGQSIRGFKKALNGEDDKPSTPPSDGSSGAPKA